MKDLRFVQLVCSGRKKDYADYLYGLTKEGVVFFRNMANVDDDGWYRQNMDEIIEEEL